MRRPPASNSEASQSSNSGCVGGSAKKPKLLGVLIIACPKWCCHIRLTSTRDVKGCSGLAIHSTSWRRRCDVVASAGGASKEFSKDGMNESDPGITSSFQAMKRFWFWTRVSPGQRIIKADLCCRRTTKLLATRQ